MFKNRLSRKFRVTHGTRMEGMENVRLLWSSGAGGFLCLHRLLCKEVRVAMLRPPLEISGGYSYSLTSQKDNLSHHHVCSDGSGELWKSLWKAWVSRGNEEISEGKTGSQNNWELMPVAENLITVYLFCYLWRSVIFVPGQPMSHLKSECHSSHENDHGSQEAEGGSKEHIPSSARMQSASKPESTNC